MTAVIVAGVAFLLITLPGWLANWLTVTSDQRVKTWWSDQHFFPHLGFFLVWLPTAVGGAVLLLILWALFKPIRQEKSTSPTKDEVTPENIEQKIGQWIDASRLLHQMLRDDNLHFGLGVSIPPRFYVTIGRTKDSPSCLTLTSKMGLRNTKPAFDAMSDKKKMDVYRQIRLECAKSKIIPHMHKNLDVWIQKQIPISPDLNAARFLDSINGMYSDTTIVMDTIDGLIPPSVAKFEREKQPELLATPVAYDPLSDPAVLEHFHQVSLEKQRSAERVSKVVDEAIRLLRRSKDMYTLDALQQAGVGDLDTEEEFQSARKSIRQHYLPDPLGGIDCLWPENEQPKWLAVIKLANEKRVAFTSPIELVNFTTEHFTPPPS